MIDTIFLNLALIISGTVLIVSTIFFKTLSIPLRVLLLSCSTSIVVDIVCGYYSHNGMSNVAIMDLFTIVEFSLFGLFYYFLTKGSAFQKVVLVILALMLPTIIYFTYSARAAISLNQLTLGLESIVFIGISLGYFSQILNQLVYKTVWQNPYFWINSGILIYFSCSFFVFIFVDYAWTIPNFDLWDIHNFVRIIYNTLILIGVIKYVQLFKASKSKLI